MLKKVLLGLAATLAVIIVAFVIIVAMQPSEYRVERSATINASPEEVFQQINDFHAWDNWSPWAKRDPNSKATFEGPSSGEGAIFRWAGNDEVGEGEMTILESRPNEKVRIQLHFIKPMEDTATSEFTFAPAGEQTKVISSMYGQNNFIGRAMCLFMDMDAMIGGDFEQGLANIKSVVESNDEPDSQTTMPNESDAVSPTEAS